MDSIDKACKLSNDAWLDLQAFKTRQLNRREKLNRHKNLHKDLINSVTDSDWSSIPGPSTDQSHHLDATQASSSRPSRDETTLHGSLPHDSSKWSGPSDGSLKSGSSGPNYLNNNNSICQKVKSDAPASRRRSHDGALSSPEEKAGETKLNVDLVECILLLKLCDVALKLPIDSRSLQRSIAKVKSLHATPISLVENLLQKFAHQELITIEDLTSTILVGRPKQQIIAGRHGLLADDDDVETGIYVTSADHTKLVEFDKSFGSLHNIRKLLIESKSEDADDTDHTQDPVPIQTVRSSHHDGDHSETSDDNFADVEVKLTSSKSLHTKSKSRRNESGDDLESLLSLSSTRERESKKLGEELLELLSKPTAKERNLMERFRSADGYQVQEFCPKGTKGECIRHNKGIACDKLHFKKIIAKHTEESLGDCSFLNTCFHMDSCKYVHYEVDYDEKQLQQRQLQQQQHQLQQQQYQRPQAHSSQSNQPQTSGHFKRPQSSESMRQQRSDSRRTLEPGQESKQSLLPSSSSKLACDQANLMLMKEHAPSKDRKRLKTVLYPPQWIQCDLRFFDMSLLGKFSVVMADPPWDIHMELPYGTMSDDEMRKLNIPALQDEGVIFLWVTGRAMELGRECLSLWGYERCDEIIWVKTNQLQRIIRTGRTGHWLNHGKEHCLVGVKGNPKDINRGLDCDVIVAEVRATSHKPDEIYGIIERLSPGTRKIELFGRAHNVQPNWITLGNQLNGVRLIETSLVNAFKKLNLPFQTAENAAPP